MGEKKVVLDTNILISAFGWRGKPDQILHKVFDGNLELITSDKLLEELRRVMSYKKFRFTKEEIGGFLTILSNIATFVQITGALRAITEDPNDDIVLETALVGDVDFIVSGDEHLLKLKEFGKVKIISAADFLEEWS